jgi:nicotinamide riboside kinase
LCSPDVPWVSDGLRDSPNRRQWFHERFEAELEEQGQPYVVLTGSFEQRRATAMQQVARLLADD